jgi:hypothetical protein
MTWPPTDHGDVREAIEDLQAAVAAGPARTTAQKVSSSLAPGATQMSSVQLAATAVIFRVVADRPCRVRLYTTAAKQAADEARAAGVDPTGDHGCTLEVNLGAALLTLDLSPIVTVVDLEGTADGAIPITITNDDTVTGAVTVTFTYLALE